MSDDDIKRAAEHWNNMPPIPQRSRWWTWPRIIRYQNDKIVPGSGATWGAGLIAALRAMGPDRVYPRGISVGCGNGSKEMAFLRAGLVEHFDLFEISERRIEEGQLRYAKAGLSEHVTWHTCDGVATMEAGENYDLVHWDNALHHMFDTRRAISASLQSLRSTGAFVMNDFVGANRFQWSELEMRFASEVRKNLPARYLRSPRDHSRLISREVSRPDWDKMIQIDPSESADSKNIIPAISELFPDAKTFLLGGAIYHLALNDILANMDPEADAALLEALLILDTALISLGESQYAACIAFKH